MYADFLTQPAAPMFSTDLGLQPGALKTLLSLMASTSDTILSHYNKTEKVSVERKADKSPVTAADKAAHEQLSQGLAQLSPDIPVLSEESPEADIAARRQWPACWVVDPLDGTKEFIGRTGEFTINVALVRDSRPVLGVIAVPMEGLCYLGLPTVGLWRCQGVDYLALTPLEAQPMPEEGIRFLASERHHPDRVAAVRTHLETTGKVVSRHNAGSALKFCALLEGSADVYPRTSPCYEWDVAAGDALVWAAGGIVVDLWGNPIQYNARDSLLVRRFIATSRGGEQWLPLLLALEHDL
jgi:3'(2'), 5'-bisphosphate nucleotidase